MWFIDCSCTIKIETWLFISGGASPSSQDAKATNQVSGSDLAVTSSPTSLPPDHQERASVGGESITSSEFETVSFTEENGEQVSDQRSEVEG